MKRVQSKHTVKVEEVFRRGDMEYIVMELAEMDMLELVNGATLSTPRCSVHMRVYAYVSCPWKQYSFVCSRHLTACLHNGSSGKHRRRRGQAFLSPFGSWC